MSNKRVVVTGLGVLTPLGLGLKQNWANVLAGRSSVTKLESNEYNHLPCRIAGTIKTESVFEQLLNEGVIKRSDLKSMSHANIYALAVAHEALKDSGWVPESEGDLTRAGTSISTGMAGIAEVSEAAVNMYKNSDSSKGFKSISPYFIPKILSNLSSGLISIKYQLKGPNHCVTTACAAGSNSILDSYNFIKNNVSDVMVCGATEASIHPVAIAGFCRMRALATKFNDNPLEASRPFDAARNGFVMSEGAACLVLESLDHALARDKNVKIYGEILGGALNADANHITNPSGDGAYRCMELALQNSNISTNDVQYINCHATSTPAGDLAEFKAIKKVFSNQKNKVFFSSLKGQLGHSLGAAGAVETALTLMACKEKIIPPSINIQHLEAELQTDENLKIVQQKPEDLYKNKEKFISLKNSFGFGGTNVSLCLSSFD